MKKEIEYICPHCNNKEIITIFPVINLQEDKELYEDLFSLNLFRVECPKCHKIGIFQYDLIVIDMYKKYIVYLTISNDTNEQTSLIKSISEKFLNDFKEIKYLRIVKSLNELLEKLLIFDYDLNDIIIENLKYNLDERVNDYPNIYFNKIEKDKLIFTCLNLDNKEVKPINIAVNIEEYNNLIDYMGGIDNLNDTKEFKYVNLRRKINE